MVRISERGYLEHRVPCTRVRSSKAGRKNKHEIKYRDWYVVRATDKNIGQVNLGRCVITLPPKYVGKKIKFRVMMVKQK